MTDLRQTALKLVEEIPEKNLSALLKFIQEQNLNPPKRKIDVGKYAGSAGNLFDSAESVENYIKVLRNDREF